MELSGKTVYGPVLKTRSRHFDPHFEEVRSGVEPWWMAGWIASLHQPFSQVVDVMNLCFMRTLLYNTHISKFQAHGDPRPL